MLVVDKIQINANISEWNFKEKQVICIGTKYLPTYLLITIGLFTYDNKLCDASLSRKQSLIPFPLNVGWT